MVAAPTTKLARRDALVHEPRIQDVSATMSNFIRSDARIFVAGHRGLAGSAIVAPARARQGYANLLLAHARRTRSRGRLGRRARFFAGRAPGIRLPRRRQGRRNPRQPRLPRRLHRRQPAHPVQCHRERPPQRGHGACSSSAPAASIRALAPQPIREDQLLAGPLEFTNRSYAIAKIAGIEMCWAFNRQYGTHYLAAMPTNLYGPGDNYDLDSSHVLPALIRKIHQAKEAGASELVVWGTGTPLREFLYSDDMADACVFLLNLPEAQYSRHHRGCGARAAGQRRLRQRPQHRRAGPHRLPRPRHSPAASSSTPPSPTARRAS